MNPPKVTAEDYINFLIATPKVYSAIEAARVQPEKSMMPAHDAFTRLLHRLEPAAATLWHEAAGQVERQRGILVIDDSTLDKPYAKKIDLVQRAALVGQAPCRSRRDPLDHAAVDRG